MYWQFITAIMVYHGVAGFCIVIYNSKLDKISHQTIKNVFKKKSPFQTFQHQNLLADTSGSHNAIKKDK